MKHFKDLKFLTEKEINKRLRKIMKELYLKELIETSSKKEHIMFFKVVTIKFVKSYFDRIENSNSENTHKPNNGSPQPLRHIEPLGVIMLLSLALLSFYTARTRNSVSTE